MNRKKNEVNAVHKHTQFSFSSVVSSAGLKKNQVEKKDAWET